MEPLSHLESFVRSAEGGSFSEAARRLGLTPAAVSKNVARLGLGVALLPMPFVAASIARGELVRLLPDWYQEVGSVYLYYPSRRLLPAKTRVFVDFVLARFEAEGFARRMRAD